MSDYERPATRYQIYRNGGLVDDDSLEVLKITESAGGSQLDTAELFLNPVTSGQYVVGVLDPPLMNDEIEIYDLALDRVVHWGKVTNVKAMLGPQSGEGFSVVSRTELFHLGQKIDGYWTWSPFDNQAVVVDRELVFNPVIDGRAVGNIHSSAGLGGDGDHASVFLDPESCRTEIARQLQGGTNQFWTLSEAVHYLCWSLNAAERYVANPTLDEINDLFDPVNDVFHGVTMRRGLYLAQALDELLVPLGYHWRVKKTDLGFRKFEFFKRGTGGEIVEVSHQLANEDFDAAKTNVESLEIKYDASRLANVVIVRGGFYEFELTAELGKAWPESSDNLGDDDLRKDPEHPNAFEDVKDVYRKWVLNEAGDYAGTGAYQQPRLDFGNELFTFTLIDQLRFEEIDHHLATTPRRRRLLPTLALALETDGIGAAAAEGQTPAGTVQGVDVEYYDTVNDEWRPANWNIKLLDQECGIYIDGERVPEEILQAGPSARVRATFTLRSDFRLTGATLNPIEAPQYDAVPLVLDLPDRFQCRRISATSKYRQEVDGGIRQSQERDDTAAIQAYAEHVRSVWNLMDVGGKVTLGGLDFAYDVGQRVSGLAERVVSFRAHPANTEAFPQIVAIERDVQTQQTTLHLQRVNSILRG